MYGPIPKGWKKVKEGKALLKDKCWLINGNSLTEYKNGKWVDVVSAIVGGDERYFVCLIRKVKK